MLHVLAAPRACMLSGRTTENGSKIPITNLKLRAKQNAPERSGATHSQWLSDRPGLAFFFFFASSSNELLGVTRVFIHLQI